MIQAGSSFLLTLLVYYQTRNQIPECQRSSNSGVLTWQRSKWKTSSVLALSSPTLNRGASCWYHLCYCLQRGFSQARPASPQMCRESIAAAKSRSAFRATALLLLILVLFINIYIMCKNAFINHLHVNLFTLICALHWKEEEKIKGYIFCCCTGSCNTVLIKIHT